jgi:hypothetical protein
VGGGGGGGGATRAAEGRGGPAHSIRNKASPRSGLRIFEKRGGPRVQLDQLIGMSVDAGVNRRR